MAPDQGCGMSARNGCITLSYARSAGTGDQPVQGTVTSRRNSSRSERQAIIKKRQEEEESFKKRKVEQEQIAKMLAQKWAQEDKRKHTSSSTSRKRRAEEHDGSSSEEVEQRSAPSHRERDRDRDRDAEDKRHRRERRKRADEEARYTSPADDDHGRGAAQDEAADRSAGWVTIERPGSVEGKPSSSPRRSAVEASPEDASQAKASGGRRFTEVAGISGATSSSSGANAAASSLTSIQRREWRSR